MAERRMFSKKITESDAFLDMPLTAQALYFHIAMNADDDGFCGNPRAIRRSVGASEDDLKILLAKRFLLAFDSGIVVVKHWKINNYIQKDRKKPTTYIDELSRLSVDGNKAYTTREIAVEQVKCECIRNGYKLDTQSSLGQSSLGKSISLGEPTLSDVENFVENEGLNLDSRRFYNHYSDCGWLCGGEPIRNWKSLVRKCASNGDFKPDRKNQRVEGRCPDCGASLFVSTQTGHISCPNGCSIMQRDDANVALLE